MVVDGGKLLITGGSVGAAVVLELMTGATAVGVASCVLATGAGAVGDLECSTTRLKAAIPNRSNRTISGISRFFFI